MKSNNERIRLLTLRGMLTALTTVATITIRIPTATKGYVNLGDTIVNISAWLLGGVYGGVAGGIGSFMADIIAGCYIYAPATLIIKFFMAFACFKVYSLCLKEYDSVDARIISAIVSEVIMITGYDIFTGFMYKSVYSAIVALPEFVIQGIMGGTFSVILYECIIKRVPTLKKR
ncbi:MAG: ECF transporter S component [Ruminococcus sp.]|nr:ECF transporter S component [Ruminococcus sp.]